MDTQIITYAGPPILGAFIGYLTNKVAIRMLFRPLKPWHVLGMRVPMTPGVIPAKRHKLAVNIGEMVGEHLLTGRDITKAISEDRFQEHLYRLIDNRVSELLSRDLGPVISLVPKRFQAYFKVAVRTLKYRLRAAVESYLNSDKFGQLVAEGVSEHIAVYGGRELNQLISAVERNKIYNLIDGFVVDLLKGGQVELWLSDYLYKCVREASQQDRCLADLLPESLIDLVDGTIRERTPSLLKSLAGILKEPEIRDRIIETLKNGIEGFVATLGPLAGMVSNFLDMDFLEAKMRHYLVEKEDDIVSWLQNPAVQEKLTEVLIEHLHRFLRCPIGDLLEKAGDDTIESICGETAFQILGVLRSKGVQSALSEMFRQNLEYMIDEGRMTIRDAIQRSLSDSSRAALKQTILEETLALIRSERVRKVLGKMITFMIDGLQKQPVGVLHNVMPAGIRKGVTEYIVSLANKMLLDEVPGVIESLSIRQTVTKKVDSLDLMKLERLLLSIMEEQFKYINLFGALLGFLLGLINLLIMQVGI